MATHATVTATHAASYVVVHWIHGCCCGNDTMIHATVTATQAGPSTAGSNDAWIHGLMGDDGGDGDNDNVA
eukprot:9647601-Lingulodinium_polyedra.AAC.2